MARTPKAHDTEKVGEAAGRAVEEAGEAAAKAVVVMEEREGGMVVAPVGAGTEEEA